VRSLNFRLPAGPGKETWPLLALLLAAGLLLAFGHIADEVLEGDWQVFDRAIIRWFRDPADPTHLAGPPWLQEAMRDITSLGSTVVLGLITILAVAYLFMAGKRPEALLLLAAVAGGQIISTLLKTAIERPRPDLLAESPQVFTASFPSGHAMLSAVTYLTIAAVLARLEAKRRFKTYLLGTGLFLTLAVGTSRVYLGVHWPTDVLAGWCVGAAWAILCWTAALWLQRRGEIEAPGESGQDRVDAVD